MTCSPSQTARRSVVSPERERIRTEALLLLAGLDVPLPPEIADPNTADPTTADAALATYLMDAFRRTSDRQVFDCLVRWAGPQLRARVRSRLRTLGALLDPNEVWQDAVVNVYRYPDRFDACRPGAFAAWSSTIVDNAIRRQLRRTRRDLGVTLRAPDALQEQADRTVREPSAEAEDREERQATAVAFGIVLQAYLLAFARLSERERFVLQMVEVRRMRYAQLAQILGIRAEAVKMVVFRARRRVHERMQVLLGGDRERRDALPAPGRASTRASTVAVA